MSVTVTLRALLLAGFVSIQACGGTAAPSPRSNAAAPNATASPSLLPITSPSLSTAPATASLALPEEQAADEIAAALQSSDFSALERLISPTGFDWAKSGSGGLQTKTPQQAVEFLRQESGGRLQVRVTTRPIKPSPVPWGPKAVDSTWTNFGNVPQQAIALPPVLHALRFRRQTFERWSTRAGEAPLDLAPVRFRDLKELSGEREDLTPGGWPGRPMGSPLPE